MGTKIGSLFNYYFVVYLKKDLDLTLSGKGKLF